MTLPDSPRIGSEWCPDCEPDRDPTREVLDVRRCGRHSGDSTRAGDCDGAVVGTGAAAGSPESGGDNNRQWCNFIHGRPVTKVADDNRPVEDP